MEYLYKVLDRREYAISIFIKYKKAFDSIHHNILLLKLEAYGVIRSGNRFISKLFSLS